MLPIGPVSGRVNETMSFMDKVEQSACADLNYCSYVFWTCAMKATDCQGGIAQPHHYPGNVSGNTGPTPSRGALRGSGFIKK